MVPRTAQKGQKPPARPTTNLSLRGWIRPLLQKPPGSVILCGLDKETRGKKSA